ncbi:MAG: glycosyltransferase [Methanomassiliicoccales archaeon]|nr:glycosyltransferase [Methanomassiliicoccales archaeon]
MRKVLFVSGSVGLGHVQRDVRIARELLAIRNDTRIVWLAADPAIKVLEEEGMTLLPECRERDVGTSVIESVAGSSQRVNMTEILYRVRKENRYAQAVSTFDTIIKRERPDLVIADEAYELEGAHAQGAGRDWPPVVFLWDYVKVYPGSWRWRDRHTARLVNKGWDRAFRQGPEERWTDVFLGDLEDVPDERLGWGMMNARKGAPKRFIFAGNPLQFDPAEYSDQLEVRRRLGYGPGQLVICSSGGTAVGRDLLRLCLDAYPLIRAEAPDLRMVVVKGPRMNDDLGSVPEGAEVKGYVPRLFEHFAAADLAVVQGGGGSTLELAALRKSFLYFPLKGHSEQEVNVSGKLERNGVGIKCAFEGTTPQMLATLIIENMGRIAPMPRMSFDGCTKAAHIVNERLA